MNGADVIFIPDTVDDAIKSLYTHKCPLKGRKYPKTVVPNYCLCNICIVNVSRKNTKFRLGWVHCDSCMILEQTKLFFNIC